jgi:hypothetical protein
VATNIKIPYWQSANAGLLRAAQQIGVKAEMVGPDTFDPKAEHDAFPAGAGREDQAVGHPGFGRGSRGDAAGYRRGHWPRASR